MKSSYIIVNFYKFVSLPDYELLKAPFLEKMLELNIKGTIILASEGINGSFAGMRESLDDFIAYLKSYTALADIAFRENVHESNPFDKSKVKLRKEIVSMGVDGIDAENHTGTHLSPLEWNNLIAEEDVLLIDTRNDYEVILGSFKGAINPNTLNFRELPDYVEQHLLTEKNKKIAMFCTGGIRCEKSTAYLKQLGFEQVFQLKGGILNYLESVPENQSLWDGSCFVFDNRVALDKDLNPLEQGTIDLEWKNKHREVSLQENDH